MKISSIKTWEESPEGEHARKMWGESSERGFVDAEELSLRSEEVLASEGLGFIKTPIPPALWTLRGLEDAEQIFAEKCLSACKDQLLDLAVHYGALDIMEDFLNGEKVIYFKFDEEEQLCVMGFEPEGLFCHAADYVRPWLWILRMLDRNFSDPIWRATTRIKKAVQFSG